MVVEPCSSPPCCGMGRLKPDKCHLTENRHEMAVFVIPRLVVINHSTLQMSMGSGYCLQSFELLVRLPANEISRANFMNPGSCVSLMSSSNIKIMAYICICPTVEHRFPLYRGYKGIISV